MRALYGLVVAVALAALGGCADVACTPATIVVADKDERPRLRSEPTGLRTAELGRVKAQRRDVIVSEYWVRDESGAVVPRGCRGVEGSPARSAPGRLPLDGRRTAAAGGRVRASSG